MRRNASVFALAALLIFTAGSPAFAQTRVYAGAQALLLTGTHTDVAGSQHGIAGGAILQAGVQGRRVALRLEGIPPVSLPQKPSAFYGQATPRFSLIDGAVRFAVDPQAHWWIGAGATVINQRTPLPKLNQVVGSRLAGVRYVARYRTAMTRSSHFGEAMFGVAPSLWGTDHFTYSDGNPQVNKDEFASELDAYAALGYRVRNTEWLFGLRALNFSAKFTRDNSAGDRNVGIGAMIEWRRVLRP